MYGMVVIGLIVNLVAMKYYELTPEKMEEIRLALKSRKKSQRGKNALSFPRFSDWLPLFECLSALQSLEGPSSRFDNSEM